MGKQAKIRSCIKRMRKSGGFFAFRCMSERTCWRIQKRCGYGEAASDADAVNETHETNSTYQFWE